MITAADGEQIKVDYRLRTVGSVLFDGLYIPGGQDSIDTLSKEAPAALFVNESYMHCKAIAGSAEGISFIENSLKKGGLPQELPETVMSEKNGVVTAKNGSAIGKPFIQALSLHRVWGPSAQTRNCRVKR